jgi:Gram-negative porin
MSRFLPLSAVAFACLQAAAPAQAADPSLNFSGFGTVGAVVTNTDDAEFVIPGQVRGADKSPAASVDSKLGLQVTAKMNDIFSATGQVQVRENFRGNWKPSVEWLFAKAQVNDKLALRVGRIGAPLFAVSDFRDVNYANTFLRPPVDVYGQVVISNFDGADALLQHTLGGVTLNAQVIAGNSEAYFETTRLEVKKLAGINVTAEFDAGFTLRVGHAQGKLTLHNAELNGLVGILATTPFAALGQAMSGNDKDASFSGVGFTMDRDNVVVAAEYTKRRVDAYIADTTGWYLLGGYRIGKFTPYLMLSQQKVDEVVQNTIPVGLDPMLDMLAGAVDGLLADQNTAQKTTSLGLRWDVGSSAAVKLQYDHIRPDGGPGSFANDRPGFGGKSVQVFSASVDFVF